MAEVHYDAFISYRHTERDAKVAKQVQHDLEHSGSLPLSGKSTG